MFDYESFPAKALMMARTNESLIISEDVATEYLHVFARQKFDKYVPADLRFAFIENIISNALPAVITTTVTACRDAKDDKFLTLVINAAADCIVTGDNDLFTSPIQRNRHFKTS